MELDQLKRQDEIARRVSSLEQKENESPLIRAWSTAVSRRLFLPQTVMCVPFSSVDDKPTVMDLSGQGSHLSCNSMSGSSFALYNDTAPYADLDGSADYLNIAHNAKFVPNFLTVMGWFYFDTIPSGASYITSGCGLVTKGPNATAGPNAAWALSAATISGVSRAAFSISTNGTSWNTVNSGAFTLSTGQWYHIAGKREGTNVVCVVNGNSTGTFVFGILNPGTVEVKVGAWSTTGGGTALFHNGRVAMLSVHGVALTDAMIKKIYLLEKPLFE